MNVHVYLNVIGARSTGYITRERLEKFLNDRYPISYYPGDPTNRFLLKVSQTRVKRPSIYSYLNRKPMTSGSFGPLNSSPK